MEHLDNIHYGRFYLDLMDNAIYLFDRIEAESEEDGLYKTYYDFDDCERDAKRDGVTLSAYGYAYYYKEGKVYECVIWFETLQCTGVNRYSEPEEIKDFVKELLEIFDGDEDEVLEKGDWTKEYLTKLREQARLSKCIESILGDLDKYGFSQIGNILHYMIDDVGPEITGKAISVIVEKEMHYNIQTCIQHLCDKWVTDEEFYKTSKLTTNFVDTYIKIYNNRLPNLKKHIARKADKNFDDAATASAIKNGYASYLVKDPEDWKKLKGPVGLAVQLCGCENFNQVIETEAQKEFKKHFLNIFFFTLKEIENLPAFYKENLSAMLVTSIEALYHDDELDWGLEKEEGVLTHSLGALLDLEYGLDFNDYITEDQVPIYYSGEDLALFGVNGISSVEYPVDYKRMAADLLTGISAKKNDGGKIKMVIYSESYLGDENDYGAPEVQQFIGTYGESDFILDRIYDGQYTDEHGDTYYESYRWELAEQPFDNHGNSVGTEIIVDRFEDSDYETASKTETTQPLKLKFSGNFGTLNLTVESDGSAMGEYQDGGILKGNYKDGIFEGEWQNKGMEGLIKFTVADDKLAGNWKKGLEAGAIRGKWKGELVESSSSETEQEPAAVEPEASTPNKDHLIPKIIEALVADLDQYQFYHIGPMLHHLIDDVGPDLVGKAIAQMFEEETHYNLQTGIKHLYDKWGNDDDYFAEHPNLTDDFIETYIEDYNAGLPNLRKHIAKKAKQNFGDLGAVWAMKNGYSGYLVKDPEDWKKLKGPVGLAIRLCGCESFDQVLETEAQKEFGHHFSNIFFFTLKELEELPVLYREQLKAMLLTSIDPVYHAEDWNLDKADGILTQAIGALLKYEFGLDFNKYITENQVSIVYSGAELSVFGVSGVSEVEYPVDYNQMAADLLAI